MADAMLRNTRNRKSNSLNKSSQKSMSDTENSGTSVPVSIPLKKFGNIFSRFGSTAGSAENDAPIAASTPGSSSATILPRAETDMHSITSQSGGDVETPHVRPRVLELDLGSSFQNFSDSIRSLGETMKQGFSKLRSELTSQYHEYDYDFYENDDDNIDDESDNESDNQPEPVKKKTKVDDVLREMKKADSGSADADQNKSASKSNVNDQTNLSQKEGILKILSEKVTNQESVGPAIESKLAELIDDTNFKDNSSTKADEKVKEMNEKIKLRRPENCKSLITTKVEELIWNRLQPSTRSLDSRFQTIQSFIIKGMTGLVNVIQELLVNTTMNREDVTKQVVESCELFSYANHELNLRRRECLKNDSGIDSENYTSLFSSSTPINEWLFGGDVSKKLDEIEKANKAISKVLPRRGRGSGRRNFRGRGFYQYPSYQFRKNAYSSQTRKNWRPFLGSRRGSFRPKNKIRSKQKQE